MGLNGSAIPVVLYRFVCWGGNTLSQLGIIHQSNDGDDTAQGLNIIYQLLVVSLLNAVGFI